MLRRMSSVGAVRLRLRLRVRVRVRDVADRGDGEVRVQCRGELERGVARVGHLDRARVRVS